MKIGTKSVLFGAHAFWLHPWFVAWAWWRLYGFPWDPRLWVAFWVHDIGYFGKPNMDGEEGEAHPFWGAQLMGLLFDWPRRLHVPGTERIPEAWKDYPRLSAGMDGFIIRNRHWYNFTLYHSRFLAKRLGGSPSRLCVADKLAIALTPAWLYLPMVRATGEIREYMKDARRNSAGAFGAEAGERQWFADVQQYVRGWVAEHRDGREDTWTKDRTGTGPSGVWE